VKTTKPHVTDWAQIERYIQSAEKKLISAHKILEFDEEAALQQAYEAMLRSSLGFMFSYGVRLTSQAGHHIALIAFVRENLDKKHSGLLTQFDRLRRKRNLALYDDSGFISEAEAAQALATATEYLKVIRAKIETRRRQESKKAHQNL
jgi:uncharacterized protein (UPF0332 family)